MRYTSDVRRRHAFRDWLRNELAGLDFYQKRGSRYLVSEFARYADSLGARVEEVSLGRYLRDQNPVLPTPESCRELARALERHPAEVLLEAGYLLPEDFYYVPAEGVSGEERRHVLKEIDGYTYLPDAIRALMKAAIQRQVQEAEFAHALRMIEPARGATGVRLAQTEASMSAGEATPALHPPQFARPADN